MLFLQNAEHTASHSFEQTVLQTLNRRHGPYNLVFGLDEFSKSVNSWEGCPVIFASHHPMDFATVEKDPAKAAAAIGGRLVGTTRNPRITVSGHPRLMACIDVDDAEVIQLHKAGELGISTAFIASSDGDRITTPPVPNHILLFQEQLDNRMPRDLGAHVNSQETRMAETTNDEPTPAERTFLNAFKALFGGLKVTNNTEKPEETPAAEPTKNTPPMSENTNPLKQDSPPAVVEALNAAIVHQKKQIEELEAEKAKHANADSRIADLEQKIATYEKADRDFKFQKILNACPEGMKATEEQRRELREKFDNDPTDLILTFAQANAQATGGETRPTGSPHTNADADTDVKPETHNWNFAAGGQ